MIIFDESKYALEMLQNGFKNEHEMFHDLLILSKYLFHIGKDKTQVKADIFEFCSANIADFNRYLFAKEINRVVTQAANSKLRTGTTVYIYESDMDTINSMDDEKQRKILFVFLVLYRLYNRPFEVGLNELFKMAKVSANSSDRYEILHTLHKKELIQTSVDLKYKVLIDAPSGEEICQVSDFDNMIMYYYQMKGQTIAKCESCNGMMVPRGRNQKYCTNCSAKIRKESKR